MPLEEQSPPPANHPPDEDQIEALLGSLTPRPGERFYRRIANAPWRIHSRKWNRARLLSAAVISALLLIISFLTMPPLQAVARQAWNFFRLAETDQIEIALFSADTELSLTLEQAASLIDFPLKTPAILPPGFHFLGANYDPVGPSITLLYVSAESKLLITQRPVGSVYNRIGVSAEIEKVQIGGLTGEYVSGAWNILDEDASKLTTSTPGAGVPLRVYWNPDSSIQTLRWEENGLLFHLIAAGTITKPELIAIAESMQ